MNKLAQIKKFLKLKRSIQRVNAYPIFLTTAADGAIDDMKKQLGFSYSTYLFHYENGYGPMQYLESDFERLWKILFRKIKRNHNYLTNVKAEYYRRFRSYSKVFKAVDRVDLKNLDEQKLISLFHKLVKAQADSVGIAHIIEPISANIERELPNLDRYYPQLTAPTKPSFFAQEESELSRIARLPKKARQKKLIGHLKKYFWIQNNYQGPRKLGLGYFIRRLKHAKGARIKKLEKAVIKKLKLDAQSKLLLKTIDFVATWQDERKKNILIAIDYLGRVLSEISRRIKVPPKALYHLSPKEAPKLNSLNAIKSKEKELKLREKGVYYLESGKFELIVAGRGYKKLLSYENKIDKVSAQKELRGLVAEPGMVRGKVCICEQVSSMSKFKQGGILVTSMTRPEFMPVILKASAIVTDEGGITSHAAIISRELGIPCIIGTKIATKVLKDGDLVEVDANRGVVKILRKS